MTQPQLPEPVASFLAAVAAHDRTAFDRFFTADPTVDDWGKVMSGLEAVKSWSDTEFIGSEPSLVITAVSVADGSVSVVCDWTSNHANGPSNFRFGLDGDRISTMTINEG
jgi:hypothetical protein